VELARNPALTPASRGLTELLRTPRAFHRRRGSEIARRTNGDLDSADLWYSRPRRSVPAIPREESGQVRALSLAPSFLFLFSARSWNWLEEMTSAPLALCRIFKCSYGTYVLAPHVARLRLHRYFLAARPARVRDDDPRDVSNSSADELRAVSSSACVVLERRAGSSSEQACGGWHAEDLSLSLSLSLSFRTYFRSSQKRS